MNTTAATPLSQRDRAVLRVVAAGRCEISETFGGNLVTGMIAEHGYHADGEHGYHADGYSCCEGSGGAG